MTNEQYNLLTAKAQELMQKSLDPVHDWTHVDNVRKNALAIWNALPEEKRKKIDQQLLTVACLWHDISYIQYKSSFAQSFVDGLRGKKILQKYFSEIGLQGGEARVITEAVMYHPTLLSDWARGNIYHLLLSDADLIENFNPERLRRAEKALDNSLFRKFLMKVLKPLFFDNVFFKLCLSFTNFKESKTLLHAYKDF